MHLINFFCWHYTRYRIHNIFFLIIFVKKKSFDSSLINGQLSISFRIIEQQITQLLPRKLFHVESNERRAVKITRHIYEQNRLTILRFYPDRLENRFGSK